MRVVHDHPSTTTVINSPRKIPTLSRQYKPPLAGGTNSLSTGHFDILSRSAWTIANSRPPVRRLRDHSAVFLFPSSNTFTASVWYAANSLLKAVQTTLALPRVFGVMSSYFSAGGVCKPVASALQLAKTIPAALSSNVVEYIKTTKKTYSSIRLFFVRLDKPPICPVCFNFWFF